VYKLASGKRRAGHRLRERVDRRASANGVGLDAQRATIEAECDRRGWQPVRIEEDVLSGCNLNRPGLQRALDACRTGKVAGVVVAKLDRLSRSLANFATLVEQARRKGWNFVALDLGVDLSTPSGEFLASVMASEAQWERRIIGQRTKGALAVKKTQGVRLSRPASIPEKLAKRIVEMRASGMTLQAICDTLNAQQVPTARGGRMWRPTSLRAVLAA
jgi:DNA invertase Pin-like site-specific DNA recombinase